MRVAACRKTSATSKVPLQCQGATLVPLNTLHCSCAKMPSSWLRSKTKDWTRRPRRCLLHAAAGYDACDPSVLVGRPATMAELVQQVLTFDRVKAVGVGHRCDIRRPCHGQLHTQPAACARDGSSKRS